jgi:hypothetical protein
MSAAADDALAGEWDDLRFEVLLSHARAPLDLSDDRPPVQRDDGLDHAVARLAARDDEVRRWWSRIQRRAERLAAARASPASKTPPPRSPVVSSVPMSAVYTSGSWTMTVGTPKSKKRRHQMVVGIRRRPVRQSGN